MVVTNELYRDLEYWAKNRFCFKYYFVSFRWNEHISPAKHKGRLAELPVEGPESPGEDEADAVVDLETTVLQTSGYRHRLVISTAGTVTKWDQTPVPVQFEEEISFCGAKDAVEWEVEEEHVIEPGEVLHGDQPQHDHGGQHGAAVAEDLGRQEHELLHPAVRKVAGTSEHQHFISSHPLALKTSLLFSLNVIL